MLKGSTPLTELGKLLPNHLADRLYRHFHRDYPKQDDATEREAITEIREADDAGLAGKAVDKVRLASEGAPPAEAVSTTTTTITITTKTTTAPPASDSSFPRHLADILQNKSILFALRTRLADTKDFRELIADPPTIFMDERQRLFFYRGIPIKLQPVCFHYLLLLAEKPKQIVARDEIYHRFWPGPMNYNGSNKPCERQISDHKHRCISQIKKDIKGRIDIAQGELETLIFTRPKVGYMLNVGKEEVLIITPQ